MRWSAAHGTGEVLPTVEVLTMVAGLLMIAVLLPMVEGKTAQTEATTACATIQQQ